MGGISDLAEHYRSNHIANFDRAVDDIGFDAVDEFAYEQGADYALLRDATLESSAIKTGLQTDSLQAAMDNFAHALDKSAIAKSTGLPVRTPSSQYKGFIAEEWHKHTLKINALSEGIPDYMLGVYTNGNLPNGEALSRIDMHVDITVFTRENPWCQPMRQSDWQSKMHDKASAYLRDFDSAQYADVNFVGGAGQGVNDTVKASVCGKVVSSDPITSEEATVMADGAKAQSTRAYAKRQEKLDGLHSVELQRTVKAGAAAGFIFSAVSEVIRLLRLVRNKKLSKDEFIESVKTVLLGTADGAVRAGAINEAVFYFGRVLGKDLGTGCAGTVPVMASASFAVDFAEDLYRCFVEGAIDADDLLCNMVDNVFLSLVSYGGSWAIGQLGKQVLLGSARGAAAAGAAIGSPLGPLGTVVGSIVGGIIIGKCGQAFVSMADKDAVVAYNSLIEEIDSHIEFEGCERIYYFADAMSSLSDFRLSFKNLLPCYNLISDLKEYNLHRKAISSVEAQLRSAVDSLEEQKRDALRVLRVSHETRLYELRRSCAEQSAVMQSGYRKAMNTYVANSFAQFVDVYEITACVAAELRAELSERETKHSYVLAYMRHRNEINAELNDLLGNLLESDDDKATLGPLLERVQWFMGQDRLLVGRQYLSLQAALAFVEGDGES